MLDNQLKLAAVDSMLVERPARVICVDADSAALFSLEKTLRSAGYDTLCINHSADCLKVLEDNPQSGDIILLNRSLGTEDGIALLKAVKQLPEMERTPVIIQTDNPSPEEAARCIEYGAYYYIGKPCTAKDIRAIVRAAAREVELFTRMQQKLEKHLAVFNYATYGEFRIRTLKEARELAAYLAQYAPDASRAAIGLTALMTNAIEHGNLGLGRERKNTLLSEMRWQSEIERLLSLPENQQKYVSVCYMRNPNGVVDVMIRDYGKGFNWQSYLDFDPSRMNEPGGRGIARASAMNPGGVHYLGNGSEVVYSLGRVAASSVAPREIVAG